MRRLPRSFFWIDQSVIRSGAWLRLSAEARLAYVALAASCDREGISIWSVPKLMELSGSSGEHENWHVRVSELEREALIERVPEHSPPAIRLREFEAHARPGALDTGMIKPSPLQSTSTAAPIVVHTQTTIHFGGTLTHVESRKTD